MSETSAAPPPPPAPTTVREALASLIVKFFGSRKWVFTSLALVAATVLFALGKVTRAELLAVWEYLGGSTILATGIEGIGPSNVRPKPESPSVVAERTIAAVGERTVARILADSKETPAPDSKVSP